MSRGVSERRSDDGILLVLLVAVSALVLQNFLLVAAVAHGASPDLAALVRTFFRVGAHLLAPYRLGIFLAVPGLFILGSLAVFAVHHAARRDEGGR